MPTPPPHTLSIRSAILRGSLLLVLVAITLSGSLSFIEFRQALQSEIARNLGSGAASLLQRIDVFFFERIEDLREWRRVEIMQDIKVGDVDKRLARLLNELKKGYGNVYESLYCPNAAGTIVAASDPHLIGQQRLPGQPMPTANQGNNSGVILEQTTANTPEGAGQFTLRTPVPDAFNTGTLGYLYAVLNWRTVHSFLHDDIRGSHQTALLLDTNNQIIAASGGLATALHGRPFTLPKKNWHENNGLENNALESTEQTRFPRIKIRSGDIPGAGDVLVGAASSAGYQHFSGFGWHGLVVEPTAIAFAPIWHLAGVILAGLLFSLGVAGWLSLRLSRSLASPIDRLTEFARSFRRKHPTQPPELNSHIREVGELNRAFSEMMTALEQSQAQLVRAGKLAVVGEMAAIMAHEVRTPLGILKTSAQMLERSPRSAPADRELTGFIVSETERLNRLVTSLLECATPRAPMIQPHNLHDILRHAQGLVSGKAAQKSVHLTLALQARDAVWPCDREQIIQVVLNLVINAIQHVPEGGHIRVATASVAGYLVLHIEDDGPGIPPADRPKVFDPFFTRRNGGIGLGLTVVQQIVQSHHGEIIAAQSPLGGAQFTLQFPQESPHPLPKETPP